MELLLSQNPIIQNQVHTKSISKLYNGLVESATDLNIATGFITNDSIAALKQIADFRNGNLNISLFIGMNYLEGFTKPQYNAVRELDNYLSTNNVGNVYLSPKALYHGKMYSFMKGSDCLAAFIGSSNLGSFVGTSQNYIEADAYFRNTEGFKINEYINSVTDILGKDIKELPTIEKFIENNPKILDGYSYVKEVSRTTLKQLVLDKTGMLVDVPLKTKAKSNLNTYFGSGKIKGRYSPRGWYEVEIILSKKLVGLDILPNKEQGPFAVVTSDGYEFMCSRQGDYSKNLRSDKNLKILGRWIKGQMENAGVLEVGTPITQQTLDAFGKTALRFEKTKSGIFLLSLV